MKKLLFLNANIRPANISRTEALSRTFLDVFAEHHPNLEITELKLKDLPLEAFSAESLEKRNSLCKEGRFDDPLFAYAHQFAAADVLMMAAPYWDLSFPAKLKVYLEHVCVAGITFEYCPTGFASLCKAQKLLYVTTAGGILGQDNLGYDYLRRLCARAFGIHDATLLAAEGLDAPGADPASIMRQAHLRAEVLGVAF